VLYWLVYEQGDLRTVLIAEASHLLGARLRADIEMPGLDDNFVVGRELNGSLAEGIPEDTIGRMITAAECTKLIERIDPIPKRPPAPSVRRKGTRRPQRISGGSEYLDMAVARMVMM